MTGLPRPSYNTLSTLAFSWGSCVMLVAYCIGTYTLLPTVRLIDSWILSTPQYRCTLPGSCGYMYNICVRFGSYIMSCRRDHSVSLVRTTVVARTKSTTAIRHRNIRNHHPVGLKEMPIIKRCYITGPFGACIMGSFTSTIFWRMMSREETRGGMMTTIDREITCVGHWTGKIRDAWNEGVYVAEMLR